MKYAPSRPLPSNLAGTVFLFLLLLPADVAEPQAGEHLGSYSKSRPLVCQSAQAQHKLLCEVWALSVRTRAPASIVGQPDWTNRPPESRDHVILGCLCEPFPRQLHQLLVQRLRKDCPGQAGWLSSSPLRHRADKKAQDRRIWFSLYYLPSNVGLLVLGASEWG